ncbi:electron transport complex subunit RsxC [Rheinheimera nanhaiensis]|uniref:Ion-translocating oxidoreductase complex subunit C n=1 Tax=Rheinheimera nanhaiensis E407-8 TaxID=562729 RepID=I1DU34_9GAMM|nr:electron transport complex subunit RsxC [Rheinheimera nanhaiensis]GAB57562.1 electron transport complex protein RnfC [Rheinheimera nanhaiensis E407-8]
MPSLFQQIQAGKVWDFHGGIHPPTRKQQTSQKPVAVMPLPDRLYIPLRQHIGVAGQLLVKAGETVLKGQPLTLADNSMAVPVHAPTSGTVLAITPHTGAHPSALPELTLVLAPDGKEQWREREPLTLASCDNMTLLNRIQESGIAGMGGAGFPTHLKTGVNQPVDYLIINAVECEPYITADDLLMQEAATTIVKGIDILCQLLNPKAVLIGIEDDKPIAAAAMMAACSQREHYYVRTVPTKYPSGGEKQLIQLLTNKEVPNGRRPVDIGIVMQNVGTAFAIAQAVLDDHPLLSRIVTVAGDTLSQPQNVLTLIGTPVSSLLNFCGFQSEPKQRVIMGGPMMGFTLADLSVPVVKTTNCILAPTAEELPAASNEMDCIRCSSCADACPASLLPQQLLWYSKAKDSEKLAEYNLADCIECGACAYVCPSEIPLVQYYRVAKAELREQQREALKAEQAKARFEARNARLEREKQERAERNQQLAAARQQQQLASGANNAVADALARIKAKQAQASADTANTATETASAATQSSADKTAILAERERKKQQAREYQQQKAAAIAAEMKADENAATDASTDQIATPSDSAAADNSNSTADNKAAAVAAAIARARAKKAAETAPNTAAPVQTDAEASTEAKTETDNDADPRKAAVAAALARAKAKKAAETMQSTAPAETAAAALTAADSEAGNGVDPRKAAIAAAIARAKAKKQADSENS